MADPLRSSNWTDLRCDARAPAGGGGPGGFRRAGPWRDPWFDGTLLNPWSPAARAADVFLAQAPPAPAPTEVPWATTVADFERWEGRIPHMYLDTKGLVTVGVGKMLPDVATAQALAFVRRADGLAASAAEIEADFTAVSAQPKGKLASSYKAHTALDLPDAAIDALLRIVVDGFEADLKTNYAGYDTYPVPAKRALLDMIYNLGTAGLLKFKKLEAAVEASQWTEAAAQCHRVGPSEERNDWTRDLFLEAAK